MGSFPGHAIPGTFFVTFALWWATQLPRRRLLCEQKKIPFFNTATFPVPSEKLSKYPFEGLIKMIASVIGMSAELFASTDYGQKAKIISYGDLEHFTMYSFFLISGIVDCFVYLGSKTFPLGMDYLALAFAFSAEILIFKNHLNGKSAMDIQLHTCLLYVIVACIIITMLEYKYEESEILTLLRSYVTLLQGTWFFQVGFILYPPLRSLHHWQDNDPEQLLLANLIFCWHCAVDFIIVIVVYKMVTCCYTTYCRLFDFKIEHQLISRGWTLTKLRLKQKMHKGRLYTQLTEADTNLIESEASDTV